MDLDPEEDDVHITAEHLIWSEVKYKYGEKGGTQRADRPWQRYVLSSYLIFVKPFIIVRNFIDVPFFTEEHT